MASTEAASAPSVKLFTRAEVAKHGTRKDFNDDSPVWLIIHNSVYDVTKFLNEHPGGEEVLSEQSGQEVTEAFEDIGHSSDARSLMEQYKIGELVEEERTAADDKKEKDLSSNGDDNRKTSKFKSWFSSFFRK